MSDFPSDYPPFTPEHHDKNPEGEPWKQDDILNHGGSCIVGPLGTFLVEPVWDKEDILYTTLNLSDLDEARVCNPDSVGASTNDINRWISTQLEVTLVPMSC